MAVRAVSAADHSRELLELHARTGGRWIVYPDGVRELVRGGTQWTVQRCSERQVRLAGGNPACPVLLQGFTALERPSLRRWRVLRAWHDTLESAQRWVAPNDPGEVDLVEIEKVTLWCRDT
jgi:hypothetical protein